MNFTISYDPLRRMLVSRGIKQIDLVRNGIITTTVLKKLRNDEPVSLNVLGKICTALGINAADVVEFKELGV